MVMIHMQTAYLGRSHEARIPLLILLFITTDINTVYLHFDDAGTNMQRPCPTDRDRNRDRARDRDRDRDHDSGNDDTCKQPSFHVDILQPWKG